MSVIEVKLWKSFCASLLQITYILKKEKSLCNCWGGIFWVDCNWQYPGMVEVGRSHLALPSPQAGSPRESCQESCTVVGHNTQNMSISKDDGSPASVSNLQRCSTSLVNIKISQNHRMVWSRPLAQPPPCSLLNHIPKCHTHIPFAYFQKCEVISSHLPVEQVWE